MSAVRAGVRPPESWSAPVAQSHPDVRGGAQMRKYEKPTAKPVSAKSVLKLVA